MTTQTAERQELQRVIDTLPDDRVPAVLDFVRGYRPYIPNAETREAIVELRTGLEQKLVSYSKEEANAHRKSDLLLSPTMNTKDWRFSREEANER